MSGLILIKDSVQLAQSYILSSGTQIRDLAETIAVDILSNQINAYFSLGFCPKDFLGESSMAAESAGWQSRLVQDEIKVCTNHSVHFYY